MVKIPPRIRKLRGFEELRRFRNHIRDNYNSLKHRAASKSKGLTVQIKEYIKDDYKLTENQKKEFYETIINKNISVVDLENFGDNAPLVSIIIINRNGLNYLKRLFKNFEENIKYPSYEIIVVDNLSQDGSVSFLENISSDLSLKIIKNKENESFARANNQAAEIAQGEYLLLLNNDVEPTYGWLNQMMKSQLQSDNVGAVGAKLVYPDCSTSPLNKKSLSRFNTRG
ncbi:glycosyltransferase [Methanobacterium ferruginis]|uniref:glycosyltransferase n=1 Tax=Methanobacterium ferruginis TaxID=710191 RepID=UPI0025734F98|nr:glycosyltransferase [Methanobacterium ferruginis]BDZ69420.1 hypothetical protein GCM10025860_28680 [Methanobacterium ferruginis]